MVTDSHCHLTHARFDQDRGDTIARASAAGVTRIVTIASDADDARRARLLATSEDAVWATAGIHPHEVEAAAAADVERLEDLLADERVVAVGETGLDYYYDNAPRDLQRWWFERMLVVAAGAGLPVVVHSRSADEDVAEMIERYAGRVRGVLHCFTGGRRLLQAGLAAGWYIGYGGIVTFKSFDAGELLRTVPSDRLLVETDAPYLAPVPMRGRRNEPSFLPHSVARIAELRGERPEDVGRVTSENAAALFGLPAVSGST